MFIASSNSPIKNTSYKVVLPFYGYAALSFLLATILMMLHSDAFTQHYYNPFTLAITHSMALGWGTMMILGASHQLFPVMIEGKLHSTLMANLSFAFTGTGIPLLIIAFYLFDFGILAQIGAILINLGVLTYLINLILSMWPTKKNSVHAFFAITAGFWLFATTIVGLLLVYNFNYAIFSQNSLHYLSLHAHLGIVGWFLLLIIGVGSRLIPMFLISKYENKKLLWWVYSLINVGLIGFITVFLTHSKFYILPVLPIFIGILLFAFFIYKSYLNRIRKSVDEQVKTSLLSVVFMILPFVFLIGILIALSNGNTIKLALLYGFTIFFGWITAIILGMTFKTLPFIIWNKVYNKSAGLGKTPSPKDLFNNKIYIASGITYLIGFFIFGAGISTANHLVLNVGAVFLVLTALIYNFNVFSILMHKEKKK